MKVQRKINDSSFNSIWHCCAYLFNPKLHIYFPTILTKQFFHAKGYGLGKEKCVWLTQMLALSLPCSILMVHGDSLPVPNQCLTQGEDWGPSPLRLDGPTDTQTCIILGHLQLFWNSSSALSGPNRREQCTNGSVENRSADIENKIEMLAIIFCLNLA